MVFQNGNIFQIMQVFTYAVFIKGYAKGNFLFIHYSQFWEFILSKSFSKGEKAVYTNKVIYDSYFH